MSNADITEITPAELVKRVEDGEALTLLDVREPYEWEITNIPGARLVPMGKLPAELSSLDSRREIVVYCRSGVRSADAARQLQAAGFRVASLAGGVLRWNRDVSGSDVSY